MKKKLSEMKYEETVVIKSIGSDLRAQVAGMGIREGKEVKMMSKQPLKGPVVIMVDRSNASIGRGLANKIMVEMKDG